MAKDCPKCGAANRDIASFCSKCGTSFTLQGTPPVPPPTVSATPPPSTAIPPTTTTPPPAPPPIYPPTTHSYPSAPRVPQTSPSAPGIPRSPVVGMCSFHPNLPAIHVCGKCGKFLCTNCTRRYMNMILCPQCLWQLFPSTPQPTTFPQTPQSTIYPGHRYQYY
jgi:hypothetical protein